MRRFLILPLLMGFSLMESRASEVAVSSASALGADDPRVILQRAASELKAKDYAQAEKDATKAMDLGYRKSSAFNTRSAARVGLGLFKEAFADADMSVKVNPEGAAGYLDRAAAREGLGSPAAEILADFQRAAELDKRWKGVYEDAQKRYAVPEKVSAQPPSALPTPRAAPLPSEKPWKEFAAAAAVVAGLAVLAIKGWRRHATRRVRFGSVMSVPLPPGDEPSVGAVLGGRYIVGKVLGREGSSEVFEARDLDDQPCRILRLARRDGLSLNRLNPLIGLKHNEIVAPDAVFEHQGHVCLAGPVFFGEPLRQYMAGMTGHRLALEASLRIVKSVCDALDFSHGRGVFHGHLTPAHILIDRASVKVKGFALPAEPSESDYLAPEQESGPPNASTDVFSLGVCLYEMLTGNRPFKGLEAGQNKREARYPPAAAEVKSLPEGLDDLLSRALAPDPARRFRAAGELFGAFRILVIPGVH